MFGLSDIGVEGRVAHKGGGLYDWHLLVDVKLTVSHLFFVASLCFMMGYGSWVHADETTHLGASTEAVSDGDDEGVVDKLLSRFGEGSATWSLGVGLAAGVYPHYPGSKQDETAVAPFPYAEYHSDRIELDRDGLAAKIFQSDRFKLDLSVNGAFPSVPRTMIWHPLPIAIAHYWARIVTSPAVWRRSRCSSRSETGADQTQMTIKHR